MKVSKLNRVLHRWGSLLVAPPLLLVIVTGLMLLVVPPLTIGAELLDEALSTLGRIIRKLAV